jgi:hypothetical protein
MNNPATAAAGGTVYTMAQLTSNVTYEQLKRIGDWYLTEEA